MRRRRCANEIHPLFIARPIFAIVLSLLMLLAGAIAFKLPLSEYPAVTPPTVQVSASYPALTRK